MPNQEISAYKITTRLTESLQLANQYGVEPAAMPKTPESVTQREVTQNENQTWSENLIVQKKPLKTPLEITNETNEKRKDVVSNYEDFVKDYDKEMYDYNVQINQKKALIISTISEAISAGCSYSGPKDAIINGVKCGIGSTVKNDVVSINSYPNLEDPATEKKVFQKSKINLEPSNFGKGFENIVEDNSGSNVGRYWEIKPTKKLNTFPVTYSTDTTCAGYKTNILTLASEIKDLRNLRNKYLNPINNIKGDKTKEQITEWGRKRATARLDKSKNDITTALKNVSQFVDDIVYDNLVIFLDATKNYTVGSNIDPASGSNKITKWDDLSNNSNSAIPSPQPPTYDTQDGPSVWFNQYNIGGKYLYFDKSYIDDNFGIVSGDVSYSLESWFKITNDSNLTDNVDTGGASIVGVSSTKGIGMQIYKPSGVRLSFGARGNNNLVSLSNLELNVLNHVVCVREAGEGNRIYINGSLNNSSNSSELRVISSASDMRVGFCTSDYIRQYFPGKISVVRMYSKALSQAEVLRNYNTGKSKYGITS